MPELQFPDIAGRFQTGVAFGQQQRDRSDVLQRRSRLSDLASRAYSAAPTEQRAIVSDAIGVDLGAGLELGERLRTDQATRMQELLNGARMYVSAPELSRPVLLENLRPKFEALGIAAPVYSPESAPQFLENAKAFIAAHEASAAPSGFREFQMTADAAGLQPGSAEYQEAADIALGRKGRASSGGFSFDSIKGRDGRERPIRRNPRTGNVEVYDEAVSDFVPLGGVGQLVDDVGGASYTAGSGTSKTHISIVGVDGQTQQRIANIASVMAQNGLPDDQINAWVESQLAQNARASAPGVPAMSGAPPARSGLGVGPSAAEEAYAKRLAEDQGALANYDAMTDAITRREMATTAARKTAEQDADRAGKQNQRALDSRLTLDLLDEAERILPHATGSALGVTRDRAVGALGASTPGAQATAQLNLIASQLVQKVPRFEGPQSNIDVQFYREAAGDLANPNLPVGTRIAALQTMRKLSQKYAVGASQALTDVPRARNPVTGQVVEYRNGQWEVAR